MDKKDSNSALNGGKKPSSSATSKLPPVTNSNP